MFVPIFLCFDTNWRNEKHKKGGWIGILRINGLKNTFIFILVCFTLKLLHSTHQGDFASLQRGLKSLINLDYKSTLTIVKVFFSPKPQPDFLTNNDVLHILILNIEDEEW